MIFIVDDDDATRDSLRLLVECEGFEATDFASGRRFLDAVRPAGGDDGDCLILDLNMPGMNGFEVLEELRHRGHRLAVILITAWPDPASRSRARAAGAVALLEKPHRADELFALVRQAVARRSRCR
jgi:two-component system response regulator FixJ